MTLPMDTEIQPTERETQPTIGNELKRPFWKVVEATSDMEQVLNQLNEDKYHVLKIIPGATHYTIVAHLATWKNDLPQLRKFAGKILKIMEANAAKKDRSDSGSR